MLRLVFNDLLFGYQERKLFGPLTLVRYLGVCRGCAPADVRVDPWLQQDSSTFSGSGALAVSSSKFRPPECPLLRASLQPPPHLELRRGGGWGLAKAAELNGMPGPAHLLELKDSIPLTTEQVSAIQAVFDRMRADAIAEGERLIALEQALEDALSLALHNG